jgi:hypothetical protein
VAATAAAGPMTTIPHRILWCYGEYQTLYGTLDGVDFQHGWPDLDKYIYLCIEIPIQHVEGSRTSASIIF